MKDDQQKYLLGIAKITTIGPSRYKKIKKHFFDLRNFWKADFGEITKAGIDSKTAETIIAQRKEISPENEEEKVKKLGIKIIELDDSNYPKLLKEIHQPPFMIQVLGKLNLENDFPFAVVGTRKISSYGKQITTQLARDLALSNLSIVSGLALGTDTLAHQAAVGVNKKTIAVLGCGLEKIYPSANQNLAKEIIEKDGAIISEFPIGTRPFKSNFPRRNRIISGLSLGVLITEADVKSGAMITAKYALEQNREVFAVPGSIYNPLSAGPNFLIKQGAVLTESSNDILETLNLKEAKFFQSAAQIIPDNEVEKIIFSLLSFEPTPVDKIIRLSMLNISVVNSTLTMMEIKGSVKNLGGQNYIKAR